MTSTCTKLEAYDLSSCLLFDAIGLQHVAGTFLAQLRMISRVDVGYFSLQTSHRDMTRNQRSACLLDDSFDFRTHGYEIAWFSPNSRA